MKGEDRLIVNSSCDKVWNVITGFSNYFKWNSIINMIEGNLQQGKKMKLICLSLEGNKKSYSVKVEKLLEQREIILKTTGIGSGFKYYIRLNPINENETEVIQGKEFYGPLMFIKKSYVEKELKKLKRINRELNGYLLMLD